VECESISVTWKSRGTEPSHNHSESTWASYRQCLKSRNYKNSHIESPTPFPLLIPTVRLLNSFLLQTWCANMLTSLGNALIYKNRFYTNLWLSNELIIKVLIVLALQFYCYFSTAVTFSMLYCLFGIAILSIYVIFLLFLYFALTLK